MRVWLTLVAATALAAGCSSGGEKSGGGDDDAAAVDTRSADAEARDVPADDVPKDDDTDAAEDSQPPEDATAEEDAGHADTEEADDTTTSDAQDGDDTQVADTQTADTEPGDVTTQDADAGDSTAQDATISAECQGKSDCTWCLYPSAPATIEDCYCPLCPAAVLPTSTCEDNAGAWFETCKAWSVDCPVADCLAPGPFACEDGRCVDPCADVRCAEPGCPVEEQFTPEGECCAQCPDDVTTCEGDAQCTRCAYSKPVNGVDDCYCTLCPTHATTDEACDLYRSQWQTHCSGDWADQNPCPVAICLEPQPTACADGTCGGCDPAACPRLACHESQQFTPAGACCPQCAPPPDPCDGDDSCSWCSYSRGVSHPDECYCTLCPSHGVTKTQCETWRGEWETHCAGAWSQQNPCPVAICLPTPPIVCDDDQRCVQEPYSCWTGDDCGSCEYTASPTSSAECACPQCPTAMTVAECNDHKAAVNQHCMNGELSECPRQICPPPRTAQCNSQSSTCEFTSGE